MLHVAGWTWAVPHAFSREIYDFYSVSPEYFEFHPDRSQYMAVGQKHVYVLR
jgi:hypothetical protein